MNLGILKFFIGSPNFSRALRLSAQVVSALKT